MPPQFKSLVFQKPEDLVWNQFIEEWTPVIYATVQEALGPYGTEPLPNILPMGEGFHMAGATASFNMVSGQVTLSPAVKGDPGRILEKLTHEFMHGSLSQFPEGDCFYEEGYVDYGTWVLAHCPIWGPLRQPMIDAAARNIAQRRERAFLDLSDWDRKRWAGGIYASQAFGPHHLGRLRQRKLEGNFTWLVGTSLSNPLTTSYYRTYPIQNRSCCRAFEQQSCSLVQKER